MQSLRCDACRAKIELTPDEYKCPKCGHKLRESPEEVQAAIALAQTAHTVKRARLWLLIASVLAVAGTLFTFLTVADQWEWVPQELKLVIYGGAGVAAVMFVLWALAARFPLSATALALLLYGGLTLVGLVANPAGTLSAILPLTFRCLVIVSLATGVLAAWKHRKLRHQSVGA